MSGKRSRHVSDEPYSPKMRTDVPETSSSSISIVTSYTLVPQSSVESALLRAPTALQSAILSFGALIDHVSVSRTCRALCSTAKLAASSPQHVSVRWQPKGLQHVSSEGSECATIGFPPQITRSATNVHDVSKRSAR